MVQPASYVDVEVRPEAVELFVAAFETFPSIGQKYLSKYGVAKTGTSGNRAYIPLNSWLSTFQAVLNEIGPNALFRVGERIIKNPYLPLNVGDVESALRHIDVAFHLSHRKAGHVMFDPLTRTMIEGIGHFAVDRRWEEKRALVRCDTPYPCPLEHGIVSGVAMQIEPRTVVRHYDPHVCRMRGSDRCTYIATW
jgi:hypothetical protein